MHDEKPYTDGECVHFVDLKEEEPDPIIRCAKQEGTTYNHMIHSPNRKIFALYNKVGRAAI